MRASAEAAAAAAAAWAVWKPTSAYHCDKRNSFELEANVGLFLA